MLFRLTGGHMNYRHAGTSMTAAQVTDLRASSQLATSATPWLGWLSKLVPAAAKHGQHDNSFDRREHRIITDETSIKAASSEILALLRRVGRENDVTLAPEYFWERNELGCAPILLLTTDRGQLVSVLYGRERRLLGMRTGIVQFGDYYGDGGVIAAEDFKAKAISQGCLKILKLPRVHTIRASFKVPQAGTVGGDTAAIESVLQASRAKWQLQPEAVQHSLLLGATFEAFLSTLGSHTRRNLRVYRKRVEQKGWKFVPVLDAQQVAAAFKTLEQNQGTHESTIQYLNCCRAALSTIPGSVYSGICSETGEWVSVSAGWVKGNRYFMLLQLNDCRRSRDSVSTVMRSYLTENLIGHGVQELTFVGGSSELLRRFCQPQSCIHLLLERRGPMRRLRRSMAARVFKHSMISRIIRGATEVEPSPADGSVL